MRSVDGIIPLPAPCKACGGHCLSEVDCAVAMHMGRDCRNQGRHATPTFALAGFWACSRCGSVLPPKQAVAA